MKFLPQRKLRPFKRQTLLVTSTAFDLNSEKSTRVLFLFCHSLDYPSEEREGGGSSASGNGELIVLLYNARCCIQWKAEVINQGQCRRL